MTRYDVFLSHAGADKPAIERLAEIAHSAHHEVARYVFANVDMFADAKRFKKALKL